MARPAHPATLTAANTDGPGWAAMVAAVRGPAELRMLTAAHALATVASSFVTVAMASSIFFQLSPQASRVEVLKYLVITVAPLAALAPILGPFVDRFPCRQRWIGAGSNLIRAVCCVGLVATLHTIGFYGWALAMLAMNKVFMAAQYALIPQIVTGPEALVVANSRLARWAAVTATLAVMVGATIAKFAGPAAVLVAAAVVFGVATMATSAIPAGAFVPDRDGDQPGTQRRIPARATVASWPFIVVRTAVGFFTFTVALSMRRAGEPAVMLAVFAVVYSIGSYVGNTVAPRLRRRWSEERMITGSTLLVLSACQLAVLDTSFLTTIGVAFAIGVASSHVRQAFDAIVQSSCTDTNRGRAFARFETRSQLGWAAGSALATWWYLAFQPAAIVLSALFAAGLVVFGRGRRGVPPVQPDHGHPDIPL